jgi:MarR family transcriptional regulator, 2-MHQ and catechol-resistance regulon repressor
MGSKYQGSKKEIQALDAFIKLKRASESISSRLNAKSQRYNLTESQLGVLESLYHLGTMCQKDLGSKILKSTGNITLVIDNLEKRKLVKRVREEKDRRFIAVNLTKEGKDLVNNFLPGHVQAITQEMSVLSPQELDELSRLCKKLGNRPPAKKKIVL